MRFKDIPNLICAGRIGMIPVLWLVAAGHHHALFVALLALTWFSDAVDGWMARTYHLESKLGARLDSIADNAVQISMLGWIYLLRPELYRHYWYLVAVLFLLFVFSMVLQVGRRAPLHTWANKFTAWLLAAFLLYTFLFGLKPGFMWVTFLGLLYAMVEGLALLLAAPVVDENTRSWWTRPRTTETPPGE